MKQAPGRRSRHQCRHRPGPRGLTRDRHPPRIAAKSCDIVLHPFQRGDPVQKAAIVRRARDRHEALDTQPIIRRDKDHALFHERRPVEPFASVAAAEITAAMDIDQNRQRRVRQVRRRKDVQVQDVIAVLGRFRDQRDPAIRLRRRRPVRQGLTRTGPGRGPDRRRKAQRAGRRQGKRQAKKARGGANGGTFDGPAGWIAHDPKSGVGFICLHHRPPTPCSLQIRIEC